MSLRIVIVGAGLIGPRHAQSILSNPLTELAALVDPASSAASVASQLQTAYFSSISSMLGSITKPDAAIVCTPNHTHVAVSRELLENGIHVLVEKPISDSIETGLKLLEFARKPENAHLKLLVGHHRRFNPYVLKTKEVLDARSLGQVIAVNGLWTLYKPEKYFEPPGDWRRKQSAGGVIPINLVHDIDVLHYLFGPVVRVHAEKTLPQRPDPPHEAEEGAALTLRFLSGVVGTFLVCDATPSPHNFETGTGENPLIPQSPTGSDSDFYRIFGSDASLSVPDMTRWSYDGRAEKSWNQALAVERFEVEHNTPFDMQLGHFVDVIRENAEPSCSGAEGLRALIVCQAARKALETGQPVDIDTDMFRAST
ncbi:Gfo/Idh/MocA family protein [Aspergillus ruber CBS 135680]|uniref:Quinate utilization oxidoreductase QutH n=1 Tax=Aspergillus ruber (strain CBS 135680) TaxID=1388766 RepID=A0A017SGH2_ASPRC|nr:quinate utilization oxidoreductase QutH [Aspergillus ruber CBS 135680]EYE95395.1 quinate utilization oxidoreductase QutH [Aspergillus ruber CBS 135680]